MKLAKLFPLLLVGSLVSCNQNNFVIESKVFCFDTVIEYKLYEGEESYKAELDDIFNYYDKISDNYQLRSGVVNVSSINKTNEDITIDERLYNMLKTSFSTHEFNANNFNPLCGSIAKLWKESLAKGELLTEEVINAELDKINNSSLLFKDNNVVQRVGESEIDLGGIAKGYVLDQVHDYLASRNVTHYLVNGGSSSILLGEKNSKDGYYNVGIDSRIIPNSYLKLKNCFVSTSALTVQGVKIGDKYYSHIVNPVTGSVLNEQDAVIVISSKGYIGDALSTSMMMNTLEEIKEIETKQDVKCIVVKNGAVTYCNKELEVLHR